MLRFVDDTFDPEQSATIGVFFVGVFIWRIFLGVDFRVTTINIDNQLVKLAIWVRLHMPYHFFRYRNCWFVGYCWSGKI